MLLHARGADAGAPARCLLDDEEPLRVGFSGIRSGNLDRLSPSRFSEALTTLQDHLLLWFCPQRSDSFVVYPPPSSGLAALLSRDSLRAGFPSQRKTQRLSAVQLQWERHLHHAVASLGGPGLFLFLLARVSLTQWVHGVYDGMRAAPSCAMLAYYVMQQMGTNKVLCSILLP